MSTDRKSDSMQICNLCNRDHLQRSSIFNPQQFKVVQIPKYFQVQFTD